MRATQKNLAGQGGEFNVSFSAAEPNAEVRITLRDEGGTTEWTTATTSGGAETLVLPFSGFVSVDLSAIERIDVLLDAPDFGDFHLVDVSVTDGVPPTFTLLNPTPIGPFSTRVFPVTLFTTTAETWESGSPVGIGDVEIILEQPDGTPFTEFSVENMGTGIPRGAASTIVRSQVYSGVATFPTSLSLRLRPVFNPSAAPGVRLLSGPTLVMQGTSGFTLKLVLTGPDLPAGGFEYDFQFEVSPLAGLGIGNLTEEEEEEEVQAYPVDFTLSLGGPGPPPEPGDPIFNVYLTSQEAAAPDVPALGPVGVGVLALTLLLGAAFLRQAVRRHRGV